MEKDKKDKGKDNKLSNSKQQRKLRNKSAEAKSKKEKKKDFLRDDVVVDETATVAQPTAAKREEEMPSYVQAKEKDPRTKWANKVISDKPIRKISREFIDNKRIKPAEYSTEAYEKNEARNRYNDILCIDKTRVVLQGRGSDDDYIHASWMTMPDGQKYICTQGPTTETVEDFWHMIISEKSNVTIMLCNLNEGKHEKCARYYPKTVGGSETFGPYKVVLKKVEADPFEGIKYQVLEVEGGGYSTLTVHHLANPNWPDHTAPDKPAATVGMFKMARKLCSGSPITVHCSAGIGRTATFVGIDYASQKIRADPETSMVDVLRELRGQRFHAIQSAVQYIFLHICLLELFSEDGLLSRKGKYAAYLESYAAMVKRYTAKVGNLES